MLAFSVLCYIILLFGSLSMPSLADKSVITKQRLQHIEESSAFDLFQDFRTPKKIAFSALMGESSHSHWVISILDELHRRGHETVFITKDDQAIFAKKSPHIRIISVGEKLVDNMDDIMKGLRARDAMDVAVDFVETMGGLFKNDYIKIKKVLEDENFDVVICDTFNIACVEAANKHGVVFMLSSSLPQGSDASAPYINNVMGNMDIPTTEFMGFWERLNVAVIKPLTFLWKIRNYIPRRIKVYKSLGLEDLSSPLEKWKDSVKMFNTAFGIQQGRPLGPLVEFVGPIVKYHVPSMSADLQNYFSNHKAVAYIAFGQVAMMKDSDVKLILTGLLEAYENEEIDGIIWGTRGLDNAFPETIVTQSNTTYNVQEFFNYSNKSDILLLGWAPQMAILNHPSTSFFISHGGSGSLYESLYSGVRMVVFPFFGDQLGAAVTAEKNGYGVRLDYRVPQDEATRIIRKVAVDADGKLQKSAQRFKALVQIRSKHGVLKGADLVEEVAFVQENGKVTHRRDVKDGMSYIAAYNIDIYVFLASISIGVLYAIVRLSTQAFKMFFSKTSSLQAKQKTS